MKKRITISVNQSVRDKDHLERDFNNHFETQCLSVEEIAQAVQSGHAISADYVGRARNKGNFNSSGFVALDFDGGFTLADALDDTYITEQACLIYTSVNHRKDGTTDKFRVLWALPRDLTDRKQVETVLCNLLRKYPAADASCKDACRMFYGNTQAEVPLQQDVQLSELALDELLVEEVKPIKPKPAGKAGKSSLNAAAPSNVDEAEVVEALKCIPQRAPGTGNYNQCLTVLMALWSQFGAAKAIELAEAWSPSTDGWNIPQKVHSFTSRDVTIASLFYLAREHGYVRAPKMSAVQRVHRPTETIEARHLPDITSSDKLVILKSYQGTGKTTAIEKLVRKHTEAKGKVLVIAHRRTLLKQISARFGIDNYESVADLSSCTRSLAVTYDSLYKLTPGNYRDALVILDEFTQGLNHLAGDTCKENRSSILSTFGWVLKNAKQVIASDADAGDPDITYLMNRMNVSDYYFLENTWRPKGRAMQLFKSKLTLQAELFDAVRNGRNVVVACDSRSLTEALERALKEKHSDLKLLKVNSKNSQTALVQDFITNIPTQVQNY
ncbi:AAA family ATPase [Deinococcus apachensis]|uniref:AAA family ATPase n=1 Tax=Deinococcus apachensis TaxID=309886 RepID=UPI00036CB8F4|nr:AAA family ATPase [Deinococcus apachensis]